VPNLQTVNVINRSTVNPQLPPTDTDTMFVGGVTQMGRTDRPVLIRSMQDYLTNFGQRVSYGTLYDWLDAFLNEAGGGQAYVMRVVGPAAALDTFTLNDAGAVPSIQVTSVGPGASGLSVSVVAGGAAGTFNIVITGLPDGSTLTSWDLTTVADAVQWGNAQLLIRVVALGANPPANHAVVPLAGGGDDRANVTDVQKAAALALIPKNLGPGQVVWPNSTTPTMYSALLNHGLNNDRFALLSAQDTASVAALIATANAIKADATVQAGALRNGLLCCDWQIIPGITIGTTRTVPPTAIVAGLIARSDRATGNPNLAAAGANGQVRYAVGKTQLDWSDAQASQLVSAGANPFSMIFGSERFNGFRTLTNPQTDPVYIMASAARLVMAINDRGYKISLDEMDAQMDGRGHEFGKYQGRIIGMLLEYYGLGAIYADPPGNDPTTAYVVNVGPDVNTPASIANREMHAAVGVRPSPYAEMIFFEIAAYPVNQPV
jgi:hypothetical protein